MELLSTILELRAKRFSDLSSDLVEEIVSIEIAFAEDRTEAFKRVNQAIERHLYGLSENPLC